MAKPIFVIQTTDILRWDDFKRVSDQIKETLAKEYHVLFIHSRKEEKRELFSVENVDPISFEELKERVEKILHP